MPKQLTKIIQVYTDGSIDLFDPPSLPQPAPPPPAASSIIRGAYVDGIPDNAVGLFLAPFGAKWVRLWHTVKWDEKVGPNHPTLIRADLMQQQGLRVLVVCTPPEKTGAPASAPSQAAAYFGTMAASAGTRIDAYEIFNEANLSVYNSDYTAHASSWITNALAPAYEALHSYGQMVVSGGWSEGPGPGFQYAISKGLLTYADKIGYHPYGSNAAQQIDRVQQVRNLVGTKDLWITEWGLHANAANPASWVQELQTAAKGIAPLIQAAFFFRMVQTNQPAGVAAPLDVQLTRRSIWYDGTIQAMNVF